MLSSTHTTQGSVGQMPHAIPQKPNKYGDKKYLLIKSRHCSSKTLSISKNYQIKLIRSQKGYVTIKSVSECTGIRPLRYMRKCLSLLWSDKLYPAVWL